VIASQSEALSALLQAHQSDVSQAEVDDVTHAAIIAMTQAAMQLVEAIDGPEAVEQVFAMAEMEQRDGEGVSFAS